MKLHFPFNPLERSEEVEKLVMEDGKRLYYRFRAAPYYGGIATADAIGCSFLCGYCWNYFRNLNPRRFEKFYSAQQVASKLLNIAKKRAFHLFRITGSEPILGEASFEHLLEVLEIIFSEKRRSVFILETNGFILGYKMDLIKRLKFRNLWVRVSLKGTDNNSFEIISGTNREFFQYPLMALKEMENHGMKAWPAIMRDLFNDDEIAHLKKFLIEYNIKAQLEEEVLEGYPFVIENLEKRNIPVKRL